MEICASSLARVMQCAGFLFLETPEDPPGEMAKEGTAAAEYLEHLLKGTKEIPEEASNGVRFTEEMKYLLPYQVEDIKSNASSVINSEKSIKFTTRSGITVKGTYDVSYIDKEGRLCVEDLKYGWGIVEPEENWQLIAYAIGETLKLKQKFKEIRLTIRQPRPHHEDGYVRDWIISNDELLEYKEKIEKRLEKIRAGFKDFTTGKNCKYCPGAKESCTAFNRLFYNCLEVSSEFSKDSLNEEEISMQLDQLSRVEEVLKIKKDSLEDLSLNRIKEGKIIPNYVQIEKFSNRVWKDGITAKSIELLTGRNPTENVFISPSKAERIGVPKELVKSLTERRLTGFKIKKKDTTKLGNDIFGSVKPKGGK